MAHKMLKPYSFLLYFLAIICSFFIGISYAGIVEAGKNQGLAGGAIVVGYALIAAFIGFLISLFVAFKTNRKIIFRLNIILALCIASFYTYYHIKYLERKKAKELEKENFEQPNKTISPKTDGEMAMLFESKKTVSEVTNEVLGLGMYTPNFYENKALYFYDNLTPGKSVQEHIPADSITFMQRENGGFDIATAPPWLVPDHLKLDYDILYFKVKSVSHDFLEVVVNTISNQTAFVDRYTGKLQYWPEFLLVVHSVEFPEPSKHKIYVKPLDYAGTVETPYSFMRPIKIESEWMYVELQNDEFTAIGKGWIKWLKNGKLLIRYSLLS